MTTTTHVGFCEDCYVATVGRVYVVIHCQTHGGSSYTVSLEDDGDAPHAPYGHDDGAKNPMCSASLDGTVDGSNVTWVVK